MNLPAALRYALHRQYTSPVEVIEVPPLLIAFAPRCDMARLMQDIVTASGVTVDVVQRGTKIAIMPNGRSETSE